MKMITSQQLKKIHVMLNQLSLLEHKATIVSSITYGRTTSSKEMNIHEAKHLIEQLSSSDADCRMRRKIFALAYEAGIIYVDTLEDKKMNSIKLDNFLLERGTIKKKLNELNHDELIKTVNQFIQIVKHKEQTQANKATALLLSELNIQSSFKRRIKAI